MPFLRQVLSKSTSALRVPCLPNRSVNCSPLSVITPSGVANLSSGERKPDTPPGRSLGHYPGDHAVAGIVSTPADTTITTRLWAGGMWSSACWVR